MTRRFQNLRDFLGFLEERGQLVRIRERVDPRFEIKITDRTTKGGGPALLFENVLGSALPVAINVYGSEQRMAWALGAEHIEEVVERLETLIKMAPPRSFTEKLAMLPRLKEIADMLPRSVKKGACQDTVLAPPSLAHLPILTCWPEDGGPFITLGAVITRHPESGLRNVGLYRMQKFDDTTTGMHWQIHKVGAQQPRRSRARPGVTRSSAGKEPGRGRPWRCWMACARSVLLSDLRCRSPEWPQPWSGSGLRQRSRLSPQLGCVIIWT